MKLILQTIPSTIVSEILACSDFDGVLIDTEHGVFNNESLYSCIQIITAHKKKCLVRFTDLNKQMVRMCLDSGIHGVIFSTIESEHTAQQIINFCRYPAYGGKRGCGLVRENMWGDIKPGFNKVQIIGQIETKLGVDNLDEIIRCDFDLFVTGPYDLSNSLGCVGDWQNKKYQDYMQTINNKIPSYRLGLFLPSMEIIRDFVDNNTNSCEFLILGLDTSFIKAGLQSIKELLLK